MEWNELKKYLELMENAIQIKILGTKLLPAQWSHHSNCSNYVKCGRCHYEEQIASKITLAFMYYRNCVTSLNKHFL